MKERFQNHSVPFENELSQDNSAISEADVLMTAVLVDRPTRQPDLAAENQALRTLSQQLMEEPQSLLRTLVHIVRDLCRADTVGVSLLETLPNGTSVFRWVTISGALEFLEQTTTPANFSPCGTTIRCGCPQLYTYPERYFTYLHYPQFPVVEALLLPLCVNSQPLGTIWIVSHTKGRQFAREDQRLMTSLAGFTATALQSIHLRQMTEQALRREQEIRTQQKQTETSLRQSEAFNEQILNGSDDCIKVLDLSGRLLYMNQRGQALIGIQEMAPFLNAAWIEFWQNAEDRQVALDAVDTAKAGGVGNFQGYCPNLAGEPKWWDVKVTPIRGAAGQVERLLCISRDITERRRIEEERYQDQERLRQSEERLAAIFSHAAVGLSEISLEGRFQRVNDELCKMLRRSRQDLLGASMPDVTHPDDVSRSLEAFGQLVKTGQPISFDKRYLRSDGTIVWANSSLTRLDDEQGHPRSVLAVTVDLSDRKQAEEALRKSEEEFRLFTAASSDTVYKMSADWRELRLLEGKNFLASTQNPNQTWLEQYIPLEEQTRVKAAIEQAICTKSTFELEHQVIQLDGTIGWTFSRAIPLFNDRNEIVEWLGAASNVTARKRAELSAEFLAIVTQNLVEATCVEDIIQTVGEQLHRYLHVFNCAFVEVNESANLATIHHCWHQADIPSLVGSYHLPEFVTGEFFQTAKLGQAIVVRDATTDPRIADPQRFAALKIGSFINVPLIRNNEWKFTLGIYHPTPYNWRSDEINLMRELANRIWTKLERTRVELALRESEAKYRSLFESMNDGFCIIELIYNEQQQPIDYRFLETNSAFERQSGLSNPIGKTGLYFAPNHEPELLANYQQVLVMGESIEFEIRMTDLGRHYRISANRHGDLQKKQLAIVFNDITERKQAEAAIAADLRDTQLLRDLSAQLATEENIQALYQEIMAAAIALTHADAGTVQILDETTQDLLLLATQGFERTMTDHFYRVNAGSNTPCGIALRSSIRSFVDFDVPASEDPDGSMRLHVEAGLLSAQSTPLISRSGKPIGMVSTHWRTRHRPSDRELRFLDLLARQAADLIEQRQAEAQRKRLLEQEQAAREEAERANRIKDEFLAVLSHELRSPLNPILGWTRLLQNGKLDAVRQREALATIERNAKLQTQLIEDLLDISRIMRGKLSLTVAPVSLSYVISAALETVRLAAEAKNIQIILDLAPEVAPVSGDAARLQQVVWNLLTNAVKFTPDGGQVIVELRQLDRLAQIRVIDTGKGINPQFLPHVFEYFRQEDGSTTRKFGGLGLGLAIVRQIMQMHGGGVWAESQGEGQGATFIVQLPTMQQRAVVSEPNQHQSEAELSLAGIQILLVDDEPDTREFQAFLLEQSGAKVTAVASGSEALQALEQSIPDVVVSDIAMAEMDGYMLLQQIRSRPFEQSGKIPAIALTAYAAEIDQQRAIQVGFQTHITKPVEPEALVKAIASLLKRTHVGCVAKTGG